MGTAALPHGLLRRPQRLQANGVVAAITMMLGLPKMLRELSVELRAFGARTSVTPIEVAAFPNV